MLKDIVTGSINFWITAQQQHRILQHHYRYTIDIKSITIYLITELLRAITIHWIECELLVTN